jgi:hypothetical protein
LVVAVVIGAIALFDGDSDDSSSSSASEGKEVVGLSESELLARAGDFGHAVYWVGPRVGTESYELTTSENGDAYIRYLTGDAEAGAEEADFLTIGSYPVADAQAALKQGAESAGNGEEIVQEDGYEVLGSEAATNVYVVFDDEPELQVEVFSPQVGEAFALATSGSLEPLG